MVILEKHPATGRPRQVGYASPTGFSFIMPSGGVRDLTPREKRLVEAEVRKLNLGFANGLSDKS